MTYHSHNPPRGLFALSDEERLAWARFALPFAEAHRDCIRDDTNSANMLASAQNLVEEIQWIIQTGGQVSPPGAIQ
jgi:hypothetical protein